MASDAPSIETFVGLQREGVEAIVNITGRFTEADWQRPTPCEEWTALDLAGHVLAVTAMWDFHLDDALAGATTPRFDYRYMNSTYNLDAVSALPSDSGPDRIASFRRRAGEWFERLAQTDPELPFPAGMQELAALPVTVRLFASAGVMEWHIHAWDFATVIGEDYRPLDPEPIRDALVRLFDLEVEPGDPWEQVLRLRRPR